MREFKLQVWFEHMKLESNTHHAIWLNYATPFAFKTRNTMYLLRNQNQSYGGEYPLSETMWERLLLARLFLLHMAVPSPSFC